MARKSQKIKINSNKLENIAQILALLEENKLGKDWLIQEVKRHHLKHVLKPVMNSYEILKACPADFVSKIHKVIRGEYIIGFKKDISSLTKTYHWFFTDIVGSSIPTVATKDQVRKIYALNNLISITPTFRTRDSNSTLILPTGDGMAIGFSDSAEKPLRLAIELHKNLTRYNDLLKGRNKLQFRIGIDTGPVYILKDLNGQDSVWGPGIIMTRRVMDLAGSMNIFASSRIAENLRGLSLEYKEIMHNIGDHSIKHGEKLILYNIYSDDFGNKNAPRKSKLPTYKLENEIKNENNFAFNRIEVVIEILNVKTMLAHHTWIWNVTNISKETQSEIHYYLDGDVPRDFAEMNVTATDEKGNSLKLLAVHSNKPTHKECNFRLNRPMPVGQKKIFKMEYDWEESERKYSYEFSSNTKFFKYKLIIPNKFELKNKIYKINTQTGARIYADPPSEINNVKDKIEINWKKSNIKVHDAYEFTW